MRELGLVGAMVNGRTLERFLDDQFFWPIFEAAEALGVPIYLHPMPPPKAVYDLYYAGFGDDVGFMLGAGAWGWHVEIGPALPAADARRASSTASRRCR